MGTESVFYTGTPFVTDFTMIPTYSFRLCSHLDSDRTVVQQAWTRVSGSENKIEWRDLPIHQETQQEYEARKKNEAG